MFRILKPTVTLLYITTVGQEVCRMDEGSLVKRGDLAPPGLFFGTLSSFIIMEIQKVIFGFIFLVYLLGFSMYVQGTYL